MVKFRRTDSELREKKVVNYYQSGWYEDLTLGEVSLHGKDVVNYYQGGWYRDLTLDELFYNDDFIEAGHRLVADTAQATLYPSGINVIRFQSDEYYENECLLRIAREGSDVSRAIALLKILNKTPSPPRVVWPRANTISTSRPPASPTQSGRNHNNKRPRETSEDIVSVYESIEEEPQDSRAAAFQRQKAYPARCGACKFPHVGVSKACPRNASKPPLRVMLDEVRNSNGHGI